MHGIRITKTLWKGNVLYWPDQWHDLSQVIRPVAEVLRPLWWAVENVKWRLPIDWELSDEAPAVGSRQWQYEQSLLPPDEQTLVARPGFLPDFADCVSGDWSMLFGVREDPLADRSLLETLRELDWFGEVGGLPSSVEVVIRGIDAAYWEVFAREAFLISALDQQAHDVHGLKVERLYTL